MIGLESPNAAALPRWRAPPRDRLLRFAADVILASAGIAAGSYLVLSQGASHDRVGSVLILQAIAVPLYGFLLAEFGLPGRPWSAATGRDAAALAVVGAIATAVLMAEALLLRRVATIPLEAPLAGTVAAYAFGLAARGARRLRTRTSGAGAKPDPATRVLLVGAGETGALLCRQLRQDGSADGTRRVPIGFIDDDPAKRNLTIHGLPVLGTTAHLPELVEAHAATEVIFAAPSASGPAVRRVRDACATAGVPCRVVPRTMRPPKAGPRTAPILVREVTLADLLRGEPALPLEPHLASMLEGRTVLITGSGTALGRAVALTAAAYGPGLLLLLDRDEAALRQTGEALATPDPTVGLVTVPCDPRDRGCLEHVFRRYRPEIVVQVVPPQDPAMAERWPHEAVLNQVGATNNLVELALEHGSLVLVHGNGQTTDGASSVLEMAARLAEQIVGAAATRASDGQALSCMRLPEVVGQSQLLDRLERDMRAGTWTPLRAPRDAAFLPPDEAAMLLLQAGSLFENGAIHVVDAGQRVPLATVAADVARLAGLDAPPGWGQDTNGPTPARAAAPEQQAHVHVTDHPQILTLARTEPPASLAKIVDALLDAAHRGEPDEVRKLLVAIEPASVAPS